MRLISQIRHHLHPLRMKCNELLLRITEVFCCHLKLQNKVVFSNFFGRGLGDDVKYILLDLLKRENRPILCWVVSDKTIELPDGVIPIRYRSLSYVFHLCTAKVWVFNIRNLYKTKKRNGQYYIQTWHGGMLGLKRAEQVVAASLSEDYVTAAMIDSKIVLYAPTFRKDMTIDLFRIALVVMLMCILFHEFVLKICPCEMGKF